MGDLATIQYVLDKKGKTTSVVVPIELWREIEATLNPNNRMSVSRIMLGMC